MWPDIAYGENICKCMFANYYIYSMCDPPTDTSTLLPQLFEFSKRVNLSLSLFDPDSQFFHVLKLIFFIISASSSCEWGGLDAIPLQLQKQQTIFNE